ncbi:MAG: DUF503 domain-containing protein [Chloroflexota bacterium]
MVLGLCTIELHLPANTSLKGKRSVLKSLMARIRHQFNVSIAEVDLHDVWQSAVIGVACVANDQEYAHGLLAQVIRWIEQHRLDVELIDYRIEML